ncbi:hypothetical protein RB195_022230 [Necator americanus]|uniref:Uncharacterized protein n=1 Tax=Necator americanus TaxID=51031 RepID=A0ABR1EEG7_NECAM
MSQSGFLIHTASSPPQYSAHWVLPSQPSDGMATGRHSKMVDSKAKSIRSCELCKNYRAVRSLSNFTATTTPTRKFL